VVVKICQQQFSDQKTDTSKECLDLYNRYVNLDLVGNPKLLNANAPTGCFTMRNLRGTDFCASCALAGSALVDLKFYTGITYNLASRTFRNGCGSETWPNSQHVSRRCCFQGSKIAQLTYIITIEKSEFETYDTYVVDDNVGLLCMDDAVESRVPTCENVPDY
ncbi:unnamed protein product, partial [Mesorhabditis spiculigera]